METVFSVGIVVAMVALVAWRRYKEGQGKPSHKKKRNTRPAFHEPEAVPSASRKAEPEDTEIRLKTPADARKAFLYSEIFRRKYWMQLLK